MRWKGCAMADIGAMRAAVLAQGRVVRVLLAAHDGSSPREAGAGMLVWREGQSGTIGGGALEWAALARAREMLAGGPEVRLERVPLGPGLGQCCGGAVTLVSEIWDAARLDALAGRQVFARPVAPGAGEAPLAVRRIMAAARAGGRLPKGPALAGGWLVEPLSVPRREVWLWGAGHVGRALAEVLAPLPELRLTWIDTAPARFPDIIPEGVTVLHSPAPQDLVAHAPRGAWHLIVTFSHALDLELCHRLLRHGFGEAGLIGSATKWARFRSRLAVLGHMPAQIARIRCPIGDTALGKHPQAIALGVAVQLLRLNKETRGEVADDGRNGRTPAAGGPDPGLAGGDRQ
ncbi:XdhC and CoxI family protein [Pseudogemmobacter humi]|uniref:XdhC and CoxI family protein n=2 Tax=Pseudogemmobacter humi TaxID=2483812 RepID=A0A3P5XKY1_9RHOB|nr:XdhC and CoxI family protein [Pseudogemmobacter humi]